MKNKKNCNKQTTVGNGNINSEKSSFGYAQLVFYDKVNMRQCFLRRRRCESIHMAREERLLCPSSMCLEIKRLTFLYTRKCNLKCTHCALECSPQETEKLEFDMVRKAIDEAEKLGINGIIFSGGEALLYFDEIVELIQKAHANKQKVTVVTNGMWSRSKSIVKSRVKKLKEAGADMLTISYDEFHKKGGARIDQIKNVIIACREAGISVHVKRISQAVWNSKLDANSAEIIKELGTLNCKILTQMLEPYGLARKNYTGTDGQYIQKDMSTFARCNDIGVLTYYPNGDVFPCCSTAISMLAELRNDNPLRLGSIFENTVKELVARAQANFFIALLARTGSCGFKALSKQHPHDFEWPSELAHKCEFCIFAAKNRSFKKWLSFLEKDKYGVLSRLPHYTMSYLNYVYQSP